MTIYQLHDTHEIPKAKAVPQAPSQEPPPPAAPEQDSNSEDEEPSESIAQHLKPTPLSPPPLPKPITTIQYPLRNRHTLHPSSQLTYATVGVPSYQSAIRVVQAVVPSPYQYNINYYPSFASCYQFSREMLDMFNCLLEHSINHFPL